MEGDEIEREQFSSLPVYGSIRVQLECIEPCFE